MNNNSTSSRISLFVLSVCIMLAASSCEYRKPDVFIREMAGPPTIQIKDGEIWIQMQGDNVASASWDVPRWETVDENVYVYAYRSMKKHPLEFRLGFEGSEDVIRGYSFLWKDPDGTLHPLIVHDVKADRGPADREQIGADRGQPLGADRGQPLGADRGQPLK